MMKKDEKELRELEPFLLPHERAHVAANLVYWRRKRRMWRRMVAQKIVSEAKMKAYEKNSTEMPLKHILALADRLSVNGAALTAPRKTQTLQKI
ncbi:MAG: Uncharacterised protein [Alphaproteobacteria bacterium]|nr:MAG: Uncharacterised protein [Alphaproteobacteria bacterium]